MDANSCVANEFKIILDGITDAIILLDNGMRIMWANQAVLASAHEALENIIGKPCHDVLVCPETKIGECPARRSFQSGMHEEDILRPVDGSLWEIRAFPGKTEAPDTVICLARNITERQILEEELGKKQRLESLGTLAGGIAHDFNNILTAIIGNTSLARMIAPDDHKVQDRLGSIEKASLRAKNLAAQLLTFSKGGCPQKDVADIGELVQEAANFALHGSNSKALFRLAADLWNAEVDKFQLSQAINNIVMNACQAMPDGGTVNLTASNTEISREDMLPLKSGRYVSIAIADQGKGIPRDHLTRIFDPFFTTKTLGDGLGLSTAYSIVKKHGGYITASSTNDAGSVFTIYLPASDRTCQQAASIDKAEELDTPEGIGKVLFMDDEKLVRDISGGLLSHLGFDVVLAQDGQEALHLYSEARASGRPFDGVILDITIPGGMGGLECLQKLKKIEPQVKAIISSGYSNDPIMARPEDYGFMAGVAKPYNIQELIAVLNRVLKIEPAAD